MQDARDAKKDHEKQREEGIKKRTMNLPNSLDIEEEEEDNQEIENSYINEIRSLKATIKRLHNIICKYKLREHRRKQISNIMAHRHFTDFEDENDQACGNEDVQNNDGIQDGDNAEENEQNNERIQDGDNADEDEHEFTKENSTKVSFLREIFIESILDNLDYESNGHEFPIEVINFCYCIYSISPHAYLLLREVLDLPSETTLKNYFSKKIDLEKSNLTDLSKTAQIISDYRNSHKVFNSFDAILGVDAAAFDRKNGLGQKFVFIFYLLPINPDLKCIPLYIFPTLNGKANDDIAYLLDYISEILKFCDINIIYTATDGDTFYNHMNEDTFDQFVLQSFTGGFYAAIDAWSNNQNIKRINDMLHCLKLARKRLLEGNIVLNNKKLINEFNYETFETILKLGNTLTDDSNFAKMSDYYALNLFSFQNLEILLKEEKHNLALYLLPFTCWAESMINQSLSRKTRLNLLNIAFDVLYQFYIQNNCTKHKKGITLTNVKSSEAVTFADNNFIIRCLNSIVGTGYCLLHYNHIGLDRIGTQIIENFFGRVRISCNHFDSYDRIKSAISRTLIRNNILSQYNIDIQIEKRTNTGGIHIAEFDIMPEDEFDDIIYISNILLEINDVFNHGEKNAIEEARIMTEYNEIKDLFLELIDLTKDDKKKLFRPPNQKNSDITIRCETNNY